MQFTPVIYSSVVTVKMNINNGWQTIWHKNSLKTKIFSWDWSIRPLKKTWLCPFSSCGTLSSGIAICVRCVTVYAALARKCITFSVCDFSVIYAQNVVDIPMFWPSRLKWALIVIQMTPVLHHYFISYLLTVASARWYAAVHTGGSYCDVFFDCRADLVAQLSSDG